MFRVKALQALHGDCLLLEYGSVDDPSFILVDGGPGGVYKTHLRNVLLDLRNEGRAIELVVLSHVDDDHVNGLLDLLDELVEQRREGGTETIAIKSMWHNSFDRTLGAGVERNLTRQMGASSLPRGEMPMADMQVRSIRQGQKLTADARGLKIPINADFRDTPDRLVCVDNAAEAIEKGNLKIHVVGPTRETLKELQKEWEEWLEEQAKKEKTVTDATKDARALDKSVPNLSSIMLLVEGDGRTVLLTGDGRGDHLLAGLEQAGLLKPDGTLHVDLFKLPHHGSCRNVTSELFERITADTYLICADGKHDNPDQQTLRWLVEAARQGRSLGIVVTSETPATRALIEEYDPQLSGYTLTSIAAGEHLINLILSDE